MWAWLESIAGSAYATAMLWTLGALLLLVVVLLAIKVIRSLSFGTFVSGGRNRKTRLAVMDAAAVDSHRRLVLVRRDDVEHLILIGGPTDLVVEQNIRLVASVRRPAPEESAREVRLPPDAQAMTPTAPQPSAAAPEREELAPSPVAAPAPVQQPAAPMPQQAPQPAAAERPRPAPAPQHHPALNGPQQTAAVRPVSPAPAPVRQIQPAPASRPATPAATLPPRPLVAPTPLRPAAPPSPASAPATPKPVPPRAVNDQPPSLDDALLEELEVTLDRTAAETAREGPLPSTVEDEMAKLLGDLARPRR